MFQTTPRFSKSDPQYRWWVLIVVMIGTLMGAIDTSIVNVSIPAIMADFGSPVDDIQWVITGYMLAFSTLMPLTAWLRDRMGPKTLYILALFIFVLGSVLCGMAWNLPSLLVARVIQAFGGGALTPIGMAMITEVFPPHERGKAMGYWGVGVIVGPAFGPTLGGYLTYYFGWRSIFMINLPIGIIGIFLAGAILISEKPGKDEHRPFDFWGFLFLSVFLVSFLLGMSQGEKEGWTSAYIFTCGVLAFFSFIFFLIVELHTKHGIMDIWLFKEKVFTITIIVTIIRSVALFGGIFLQPLFLQQHMGLDEIESGLILLPGSLVIGVSMPLSGKFSDKTGPRYIVVLGMIFVAIFMFMYHDLSENTSTWDFIKPTLIRGVGLGMLMAPVMAAAMNSVPQKKAAMASAMMNLNMQVGGSLGIAFLSTTMSHRFHYHLGIAGDIAGSSGVSYGGFAKDLFYRALSLGHSHMDSLIIAKSQIASRIVANASVTAFQDAFIVGGILVLVAIIPSMFLPAKPARHTPGEMTIME